MTATTFYTPNRQKLYLLGGGQVDAVKVGARIKAARKVRRLTQAELAQEVDITPKYLSNIECGAKVPKLETFIEIANALEVDANTFAGRCTDSLLRNYQHRDLRAACRAIFL